MTELMGFSLALQDCQTEADAVGAARRQSRRLLRQATRVAEQDDQRRRTILTRTVELDVIPRLLIAHPAPAVPAASGLLVTAAHVVDLVALVLSRGKLEAAAFVEGMHDQGALPESLYLDLLAPAARRLDEMWDDDVCDFTEVTVGLWRLQNMMRELSPFFQRSAASRPDAPRALLVLLPGEDHTFGLSMVHEFFRRAGWDAWSGPVASSADLRGMVRREWVEVIGFSLACDEKLDAVRAEIRSVRRASKNPGLGVLVGGPGFTANPSLSAEVGADGTATDGRQAVLQAQALLDLAAKRR